MHLSTLFLLATSVVAMSTINADFDIIEKRVSLRGKHVPSQPGEKRAGRFYFPDEAEEIKSRAKKAQDEAQDKKAQDAHDAKTKLPELQTRLDKNGQPCFNAYQTLGEWPRMVPQECWKTVYCNLERLNSEIPCTEDVRGLSNE